MTSEDTLQLPYVVSTCGLWWVSRCKSWPHLATNGLHSRYSVERHHSEPEDRIKPGRTKAKRRAEILLIRWGEGWCSQAFSVGQVPQLRYCSFGHPLFPRQLEVCIPNSVPALMRDCRKSCLYCFFVWRGTKRKSIHHRQGSSSLLVGLVPIVFSPFVRCFYPSLYPSSGPFLGFRAVVLIQFSYRTRKGSSDLLHCTEIGC